MALDLKGVGTIFDRNGLVVGLAGEDEAGASELADYDASERGTLEFFVANEVAIASAVRDALAVWLEEQGHDLTPEEDDEDVDEEVSFDSAADYEDQPTVVINIPPRLPRHPLDGTYSISSLEIMPGWFVLHGRCDWDPEHGLRVEMERLEVVGIGNWDGAY